MGKLDRNKWITRYFWGEELLNESYSLKHEKHCITDGKNLEINRSIIRIVTKKEKIDGKIWDPEIGFAPHEFMYSSGLVNTGKSFKQTYGLFEAKIKIADNPHILNAFWMVGDRMVPHIDIVNAQKNCSFGAISGESTNFRKSIGRKRFSADFYIYTMEWTNSEITWKINGLEVASLKGNIIPQDEMYISLNGGLFDDIESGLPATMEVDWVRCYKNRN
jgi:beta-glucanase (GH16 family)